MQRYLEIIEQLSLEQKQTVQAQEIRIKVDSKDEAISLLSTYEPIFEGLNYIKRLHTC